MPHPGKPTIAYFCMEVGLRSVYHTYSGGLGVLAGDTIREAADLRLPMVAVTLAHRSGYFRQRLDESGGQLAEAEPWSPETHLEPAGREVSVVIEGRRVRVRAWVHRVQGVGEGVVPVYFLDTDLEANTPQDRTLTHYLYGGDTRYRLAQEALLGLGGAAFLRGLGLDRIRTFHMNEGHSAFVGLSLLERELAGTTKRARGTGGRGKRTGAGAPGAASDAARGAASGVAVGGGPELRAVEGLSEAQIARALEKVRKRCVFTTHTPVAAGHDRFPRGLAAEVLGEARVALLDRAGALWGETLNMSEVAIRMSRFVNGVAFRHGQISQEMFPEIHIHPITNGVHARTWMGPELGALFHRHIPEWDRDPFLLRHAIAIPTEEIRQAHRAQKERLLAEVERRTGRRLDPDVFTVAFARRATAYKRADLLFRSLERLREMAWTAGPMQILYAGRAHPRDEAGQRMIQNVVQAGKRLGDDLPAIYLENYDMDLGALLTQGADLWLNNPRKPLEASGTSGMKAALNGIPSLSVVDGWWVEGHVEGVTGWAVGGSWSEPSDDDEEARSIMDKLEGRILPLFYQREEEWRHVMRWSIALNGAHFQTRRMMLEYMKRAYGLPEHLSHPRG